MVTTSMMVGNPICPKCADRHPINFNCEAIREKATLEMFNAQHTDEPSIDDLTKLVDEVLSGNDKRGLFEWREIALALARALRSRLSHPTLSAERLAEIQKRHDTDCEFAVLPREQMIRLLHAQYGDIAELLSAHHADRNAVIEECAKVVDQHTGRKRGPISREIAGALRVLKQ